MGEYVPEKYDYWHIFRLCVNELKIAPSEAWALDFVEVLHLVNSKQQKSSDTSIMLNFERIQNGASSEWLQKKN